MTKYLAVPLILIALEVFIAWNKLKRRHFSYLA
jgi:hypothetical protein